MNYQEKSSVSMDFFPSFGLKSLAVILKLKKEFSDSLQSPFFPPFFSGFCPFPNDGDGKKMKKGDCPFF
jgi:hypothetical protein